MRVSVSVLLVIVVMSLLVAVPATEAKHHEGVTMTLEERLQSASRPRADKRRDAGRKPLEVMKFAGVKPGMTAVDLIAASGYYTEVLSYAVGDHGRVYAQNPQRVLQFRNGANDMAMSARLAGDRLANVERRDMEIAQLDLGNSTIDVALMALSFHNIYNGSGRDAALDMSRKVHELLKPGGVFVIIDHHGKPSGDNRRLQRIDVKLVKNLLKEAGFKVRESKILRNKADSRDLEVFDPSIRGQTDRFVLRATK